MRISLSEITAVLRARGVTIVSTKDVQNGVQLKLLGATITAFTNGNALVQGQDKKTIEDILNGAVSNGSNVFSTVGQQSFRSNAEVKEPAEPALSRMMPQTSFLASTPERKKVFIVHGHDRTTLLELNNFLYRNNYDPIVLSEQRDGGDTIIEKLERHFKPENNIVAAIVLATPDDIYDHPKPNQQFSHVARCRPNVELELGFVIAFLSRKKLIYLRKSVLENVEFILPSDVLGVVYQSFSVLNTVEHKILSELAFITEG